MTPEKSGDSQEGELENIVDSGSNPLIQFA